MAGVGRCIIRTERALCHGLHAAARKPQSAISLKSLRYLSSGSLDKESSRAGSLVERAVEPKAAASFPFFFDPSTGDFVSGGGMAFGGGGGGAGPGGGAPAGGGAASAAEDSTKFSPETLYNTLFPGHWVATPPSDDRGEKIYEHKEAALYDEATKTASLAPEYFRAHIVISEDDFAENMEGKRAVRLFDPEDGRFTMRQLAFRLKCPPKHLHPYVCDLSKAFSRSKARYDFDKVSLGTPHRGASQILLDVIVKNSEGIAEKVINFAGETDYVIKPPIAESLVLVRAWKLLDLTMTKKHEPKASSSPAGVREKPQQGGRV